MQDEAGDDADEKKDSKGSKKKMVLQSPVISDGRFVFVVMPTEKKGAERMEMQVHALDPQDAKSKLEHCHTGATSLLPLGWKLSSVLAS